MMKSLKALVESKKNMTSGNHAVKYLDVLASCYFTGRGRKVGTWEVKHVNGFTRKFQYHDSTICLVDDVNRRVILTNAGWDTSSTSRAVNDYRRYFVGLGYQVVKDI